MRDLWTYPVSFPYGATTPPYTSLRPHKGEDRAAPKDTPIPVNGVVLGTVGTTGASTGYHTHIGKWAGGISFNPAGGGQTLGNDAVVVDIDKLGKTDNGKYVRIRSQGFDWVYLHMNDVRVAVGDKLRSGGNMKPDPNQMNQLVFFCWGNGAATAADMEKINSQANVQDALNLILGDDRTGRWYTKVNELIANDSGSPTVVVNGVPYAPERG